MTRIKFFKTRHGWRGFEAQGHSGFARSGRDLVCSAVSALTQTAVLGLDQVLQIGCLVEEEKRRGFLLCLLPQGLSGQKWEQAQLVLEVLYAGLSNLSANEEYRKYISLKEVPYRENRFTAFRHQKRRGKLQERPGFGSQALRREKP